MLTPDPVTVAKVSDIVAALPDKDGRPRRIDSSASLTDAGVTSLDMVNLMLALEASFDSSSRPN